MSPFRTFVHAVLPSPSAMRIPAPVADSEENARPPEIRCLVALTAALLGYGLPSHRVEEAASRLGRALGCTTTVLGMPTALSMTIRAHGQVETTIVRAEPGGVDLARLDSLHALVGRIERGELDATGAGAELGRILSGPDEYGARAKVLGAGLVGGGAAPVFGAGVFDALVAFVLGAAVGALLVIARSRPALARTAPMVAAVIVSLASAACAHALTDLHPLVITISSLLLLVPGLAVTLATVELATGHWVCGTARTMGAVVAFSSLAFGILVGLRFGAVRAIVPTPLVSEGLGVELLGALAVAIGFGITGNARPTDAAATFFVSALAYGSCRGLRGAIGIELASLSAAFLVGIVSHAFARRYDRPSSILLLPGAWMLVPGSFGMLGISRMLMHDTGAAVEAVVRMAVVAFALGTGFVLATSALPPRSAL